MSDWTELILVIRNDETTGIMPPEEKIAELRQVLENWRWEQIAPFTFRQNVYRPDTQTVLDNVDDLPQKYGVEFWVFHSEKLSLMV